MSELDVIRLMMAIGVLLLMAASAGFGILWQRQQNLVATLQSGLQNAMGTPLQAATNDNRSVVTTPLHNLQTQPIRNSQIHPSASTAVLPERLEPKQPQTAFATEAARYQSLLETARAQTAREAAGERSVHATGMHINAPLGGARSAPVATMQSEEDRLRALLSGRSGRVESSARGDLSRGGFGREPRLY